jgi:hypothetical protein
MTGGGPEIWMLRAAPRALNLLITFGFPPGVPQRATMPLVESRPRFSHSSSRKCGNLDGFIADNPARRPSPPPESKGRDPWLKTSMSRSDATPTL